MLFGLVDLEARGIVFSMITLGLGELVASPSFILRGFFGGEEAIVTNRTKRGHSWAEVRPADRDLLHDRGLVSGRDR